MFSPQHSLSPCVDKVLLHRSVKCQVEIFLLKYKLCHSTLWVFENSGQQLHPSKTKQIRKATVKICFRIWDPLQEGMPRVQQTMKNHPSLYPLTIGAQNSCSLSTSWLQPAKRALCFACSCTEAIYFLIGNGDAERAEPCHTWGSHYYREQKLLPAWLSCHLLGCCDSSENGAYPIPVSSRIESVSNPCLLRENNGQGSWGRKGGEPLPWNSDYWAP